MQAAGANVHLAHPLGVKGFRYRRVKKDVRDASDRADLLRMNRLPEAWIAPPEVRELRELVRYPRAKLVTIRSNLKAQVHSVLGKAGVQIAVWDLFGVTGRARLARVPLGKAYAQRVLSLQLIDDLDTQEARFTALIARRIGSDPGYRAVREIPGVGPVLAVSPRSVTCTGSRGRTGCVRGPALTPRHHESDTTVHRGAKQGSRLVRWAAVEAIQLHPSTAKIVADRTRIQARRGKNIAKVAAARKPLPSSTTGSATDLIVDYIDAHRSRFGVDPICTVLTEHGVSIAPSTYYQAKQRGRVSSAGDRTGLGDLPISVGPR